MYLFCEDLPRLRLLFSALQTFLQLVDTLYFKLHTRLHEHPLYYRHVNACLWTPTKLHASLHEYPLHYRHVNACLWTPTKLHARLHEYPLHYRHVNACLWTPTKLQARVHEHRLHYRYKNTTSEKSLHYSHVFMNTHYMHVNTCLCTPLNCSHVDTCSWTPLHCRHVDTCSYMVIVNTSTDARVMRHEPQCDADIGGEVVVRSSPDDRPDTLPGWGYAWYKKTHVLFMKYTKIVFQEMSI